MNSILTFLSLNIISWFMCLGLYKLQAEIILSLEVSSRSDIAWIKHP